MDNPIYNKNYERLKRRWSFIVDYIELLNEQLDINIIENTPQKTLVYKNLHLSSCYDRANEALIQNSTIPHTAERAHLYGVGFGDSIHELLQRKSLQRLDVHILSPVIFYLYLNFFDACFWLDDKRIHLHLAHNDTIQFPYAVNAAELFLAEEKALEIKNLIQIDRNNAHQSLIHKTEMLELYRNNRTKNQIFTQEDDYIEVLVNQHKNENKSFVLVAGGPTATAQFTWLKQKRKEYIIIAASTALIALEHAEIIPDYVAVLDPQPLLAQHFVVQHQKKYQNKVLAYYPTASYEAIKAWPGKRFICLNDINPLLKEEAQIHPKSILFMGGSVAHTTAALAILLGAETIILLGFDFCFAHGQSHLEHNPLAFEIANTEASVINGYNQIVPSQLNLIGYKQALEEFIAITPQVTFYNTGKEGAVIKGTSWI